MAQTVTLQQSKLFLGAAGARIGAGGGLVGLFALATAAYFGLSGDLMRKHFFHSYLFAYVLFLSLSLGALFFVLLHHLTRAGWSVTVRRIAEALSMNIFLMAILALPLLSGLHELFHWTHPEAVEADPILQGKSPYLNMPFFLLRLAGYFAFWCFMAWFYRSQSVRQDSTGDPRHSLNMEKLSAPGMILFGFSITFFFFDWVMGLNAHWFSTIFGVYFFAGCALGGISLTVLIALWLRQRGLVGPVINNEHYQDLGKLMFAFTFFWGYIAFSQYMLIWYSNMPEETQFYIPRQLGVWGVMAIVLVFVHLLIPFPGLLSRHVKRRNALLAFWAVWSICAHALDMYWLIIPAQWINEIPERVGNSHMLLPNALPKLIDSTRNVYMLSPQYAGFSQRIDFAFGPRSLLVTAACLVGIGGLYLFTTMLALRGCALVPLKDPRLAESLKFENI